MQAKRRPLPEALPRDEVVIDIPEEQKHCLCGAELVRIGEETSEKLDVIPPAASGDPHHPPQVCLP